MSVPTSKYNAEAQEREWGLASQQFTAAPNYFDPFSKIPKYVKEKTRHDLVPPEAIEGMAKVLTFGANKYSDRSWELGMDWGLVYAALQRHMLAWWGGQNTDPETGLSHLHHAACWVAFLQTYEARSIGEDTRSTISITKEHGTNLN